jgi:hypothetical protein
MSIVAPPSIRTSLPSSIRIASAAAAERQLLSVDERAGDCAEANIAAGVRRIVAAAGHRGVEEHHAGCAGRGAADDIACLERGAAAGKVQLPIRRVGRRNLAVEPLEALGAAVAVGSWLVIERGNGASRLLRNRRGNEV